MRGNCRLRWTYAIRFSEPTHRSHIHISIPHPLTPSYTLTLDQKSHMVGKPGAGVKAKPKQYRTPCPCGCKSTSSSTIAAHKKEAERRAKLHALAVARSVSGLAGSSVQHSFTKHPPCQKQGHSAPPTEERAPDHEGAMEVDLPQEGGSGEPLAHIWADRASRREREDEDLLSEPGSPELSSEDEDETENGNLDCDEPVFLSDDEDPDPPVHMEISATEQLTTDFQ